MFLVPVPVYDRYSLNYWYPFFRLRKLVNCNRNVHEWRSKERASLAETIVPSETLRGSKIQRNSSLQNFTGLRIPLEFVPRIAEITFWIPQSFRLNKALFVDDPAREDAGFTWKDRLKYNPTPFPTRARSNLPVLQRHGNPFFLVGSNLNLGDSNATATTPRNAFDLPLSVRQLFFGYQKRLHGHLLDGIAIWIFVIRLVET